MTDVELLPLPEFPVAVERFILSSLGPMKSDGARTELRTMLRSYARANVAHATAAKDAEIEALRESLDWTVKQNDRLLDEGRELTARAEQLQAELDNRWATGVHTCQPDKCQRVACVLRREIEALRAEVERLAERNAELEGAHEHCELMKHKLITCGVAADHPDPNLSRTGVYASKWNSPQAERVRGLRDRAERLAEALRIAEAALADIGDADREPGDDVSWCERRAALGLRVVRAALRDHDQEGGNG